MRYTVLSPTLCKTTQAIQPCLIPISFLEICVSSSLHKKGTSWKSLLISFSQTQWSVTSLSFMKHFTVSQALSTCSLAFCPIIMLSLDFLEVLLLLHWELSVLLSLIILLWILMPKVFVNLSFYYSLFLEGKLSYLPYLAWTWLYSMASTSFSVSTWKEENTTTNLLWCNTF